MPPNPITHRIYDFLKEIPPFSYLDKEVILQLCERVEVQYHSKGARIFEKGEQPRERFFVIREGAVDLQDLTGEEPVLIEHCGEGELFGIRPLLAEDAYQLRAVTAEDTLLYAIHSDGIREQLDDYPKVSFYLASVMARGRGNRAERLIHKNQINPISGGLLELQAIHRAKPAVTCAPNLPTFEAAEIMTEEDVSYIVVVDEKRHPLGILTDRDIRRNIATGVFGRKRLIKDVMTTPVVCVPPELSIAEIQIAMVKYEIYHLAVTEDGTMNSPINGLISEQDLLVLHGNNPAVLVREISRSLTGGYLRELRERAEVLLRQYLEQEVSISYITTIMTEINDEIIRRCVELSIQELVTEGRGEPPRNFSWMCLGSQGRGEQLLRTDQDSALVYENDADDNEESASVKAYFLDLAERTTEKLYAVGYDYCSGNMMASNPSWCQSVSGWKDVFSRWMDDPSQENILNVSVFFDFRCVFGTAGLTDELTDHIFHNIEHTGIFRNFLARAALQNPAPLTFFRNFMVERSGEHKDSFDLKARAMMPLTDAARILILTAKRGGINNTIRRFQALAELEPQNAEVYQNAADAYETLIRLRALIGLRRGDNGRYIKPGELTRLQRVLLRNTFTPVSDIQELIEVRFQLNFIR
ncbi:nucleotidyltransferase [Lewinellaceae bacterium SD302]|nr:nucleotidyltransferase [Lewinellaceae bacterium SD302]